MAHAFARPAPPEVDIFAASFEQLMTMQIETASRVSQPIAKTSASVSVIQASEIRGSGARTLADILALAPGFSVEKTPRGQNIYILRGVRTFKSEKILFLLNGRALKDARSGSTSFFYLDALPVENIERVEIVRGTGGRIVHGYNALIGVVNIITKTAAETSGLTLSGRGEFEKGNHIGQRYNLLYGGETEEGTKLSLNGNYIDEQGPELYADADRAGRSGLADSRYEHIDLQALVEHRGWTFRSRYFKHRQGGYFGISDVLNDETSRRTEQITAELRYDWQVAKQWDLSLTAYGDHLRSDIWNVYWPAGSIPPDHAFYPWNEDGRVANNKEKHSNVEAEFQAIFNGFAHHQLLGGGKLRSERIYDIQRDANFGPEFLPELEDVSDRFNFLRPADRHIESVYLEDLWDVKPELRLTTGMRYDHYSDFGGTFNWRVGLAWQLNERTDLKMSYGTGYREPDFRSQFVTNSSVILGNPDLEAETVETFEVSGGLAITESFLLRATAYNTQLSDLIDTPADSIQLENVGSADIVGLELEGKFIFGPGAYLSASYTYTDSETDDGSAAPLVPEHSGSLLLGLPIGAKYDWTLSGYWRGDSPREPGDDRADLGSYQVVNTTLSLPRLWRNLDLQFSIFNVFDESYVSPSPANRYPGDYPAAGRSFLVSASYVYP